VTGNGTYEHNGTLHVKNGEYVDIDCEGGWKTKGINLPSGNTCHDGACKNAMRLECHYGQLKYNEYGNGGYQESGFKSHFKYWNNSLPILCKDPSKVFEDDLLIV
jgi:hypothetical protein